MTNAVEKLSVPDVAGLTVLDMEKNTVELASLWRGRRVVLTFLRHFG